ncbi:hypothetical protein [Flexithrix dorotheae]|uniref:hypothetical protein n=1 Tax=Flexithrix dorotheae TaxID=70993 RepID=UPI00037037F9|nr:hypothetical protein [Flexithrix dorotheae]
MYQELTYPLNEDTCYQSSVILSRKGYPENNDKAMLRIGGGNNECVQEELFWTSEFPFSGIWSKHEINFTPGQSYYYLILESYHGPLQIIK